MKYLPKIPKAPNEGRHISVYRTLLIFLIGVVITASLLTAAAYALLLVVGLLANPFARLMTLPILMAFFIMTLAAGVGKGKLKPINDLVNAMRQVSQGDFSVRVDDSGLNDDIARLSRSFNDMAADLGGLELFRKDFINNFSHEFKTPIVSIRGFAKQLEREDLTEDQRREYLEIIVSESDRLANMSGNVLLLSKLENQTIITDRAVFSLDEQLRHCILLLENKWTQKSLELEIDLNPVDYDGNEEMMRHVWVNLINNAVKFSPEGGTLWITLIRENDAATVTVRDQGPGMNEATRRRIFEKFYQGDTAHATEGNGLGLSLVKRIVDLCNGTITVESSPGAGAAFTVMLPLAI